MIKFFKIKRRKNRLGYSVTVILTVIVTMFLSLLQKKATTASVVGTMSMEVLKSLVIENPVELNFGLIAPELPLTGGVLKLNKDSGTITCLEGSTCLGNPVRGLFTVLGSNGPISLSYVDGTLSDGTHSMNLSVNGPSSVTIVNGTAEFYVGGDVTIGSEDLEGAGSGDFNTRNSGGMPYMVNIVY